MAMSNRNAANALREYLDMLKRASCDVEIWEPLAVAITVLEKQFVSEEIIGKAIRHQEQARGSVSSDGIR